MSARHARCAALALTLALAAAFAIASDAEAGRRVGSTGRWIQPAANVAPRTYSGGALLLGLPYRDYEHHVGKGVGFDAVGSNALNASGISRVRSDVTLLYNLNKDQPVPGATLASLDQLTLGTSANLFHFLIGPEVAVPTGGFRPYVFGLAGFGTAYVRQKLDGRIGGGVDAYHLDSSRHTSMFTWGFGAGVRLKTSSSVLIDLGAEYREAMGARMITPDRVSTAAGLVGYAEQRVDADQIIVRLGFARAK